MYIVFGIIELLLILRFVLLFIGANAANTFVTWVYTWSGPFAAPFAGIFGQHSVAAGQGAVVQSVFDWTSLVALIAYAVIGAVLVRLLSHI